jgi:Tfp pilus assembly protein PilV
VKLSPKEHTSGTTLIETLVAIALLVGFFVTMFELNATCLRFIDSTKETVGALQGVQDRLEALRNLAFSDLISTDVTNPNCVPNLMKNPANTSDFAKRPDLVEVVTLSAYPTPDANNTQITRGSGASVTSTINSTDASLADQPGKLVKVNVTYTWTKTLGGRSCTEQTETIIASGTKK